jgi:hypothetical protein
MNQKSKYIKKYGMPRSNANTLVDIGAVYHKMLLENAAHQEQAVIEEKKTKKLADPKAKFGTKPGKGGIPLELVKDKKPDLDPELKDFAHKDSGPDLKQLSEPIDPKEKKFRKNNYFNPEELSSANESVINNKNVSLIADELTKEDKNEAYERLCEYKTLWGKDNFINLLTVAAVNGHTEALEEFFSFVNKNTKNRKDNNK